MKKIFFAIGFLIFVLAVVGTLAYYYFINIKFYRPGELAADENISMEPPSQAGVEQNYWRVEDNINLYHFEQGEGKPVLVIHGGPGIPPERPWLGLENLSSEFKFYYYHQRGCGLSTRPIEKFESKNYYQNMKDLDAKLGMGQQIADIERIRKIIGKDKITIIGHSYGGFMATLYALEFPQNIEKLVLVNPAGVLKMPPQDENLNLFAKIEDGLGPEDLMRYRSWQDRYFNYGRLFDQDEKSLQQLNYEFLEYFEKYLVSQGMNLSDRDRPKLENIGGFMVQAMYMSMGRSYDYRNKLLSIEVPTLVLQGGRDFSPEAAYLYDGNFGNSKLEMMEDGGHFLYNKNPQEFGDRVGNFIRR